MKELEVKLRKAQEQVDHRELPLRKYGITDFSLNQHMKHLAIQGEEKKKEENVQEVQKDQPIKEEKETTASSSGEVKKDKKGMPYLSKQENKTLRRRGLFFRSEAQ